MSHFDPRKELVKMKKLLFFLTTAIIALSVWASEEYTVYGTYYHPSYGTHTASGDRIVSSKVKSGEHRWVALSRDMFRKNGFKLNDTILVTSEDNPCVNGYWVVKDKMGGHKKIDFLMHRTCVKDFRNGQVTIQKVEGVEFDDFEMDEIEEITASNP